MAAAGALVLWVLSSTDDAVHRLPLMPQVLQLVGLWFSTWFFFRSGPLATGLPGTLHIVFHRVLWFQFALLLHFNSVSCHLQCLSAQRLSASSRSGWFSFHT